MATVEVVGLSADGARLVLQVDGEEVEIALEDVRRAERQAARKSAAAAAASEPLTPKSIQQRIRCGESAREVASAGGWPVEVVARYEGPPLAERAHHADLARRSRVDGWLVEELVAGHLRQPPEALSWDAWLIEDGRWEVRVTAAGQAVRLRWDASTRRVQGLDEHGRRALRDAAIGDDVLTAVLRPVSIARDAPREVKPPARTGRRAAPEVPAWADIAGQVAGRYGSASDAP